MADPPAEASRASLRSSTFRQTLLKLVAVTAGLVVGIAMIAVVAYWIFTRPKPWNTNAVTARFKRQIIYENHDKPNDIHYYPNVFFDVTNNTGADYVFPIDAWQHHLMETQSGSLLGASGWTFALSQATMPYNIPADLLEPKPIPIPAHTTVEVNANFDFGFTADHIRGKTKEEVVAQEFPNTDELVAFDEATHYRISFPTKGIWQTQQRIEANLNKDKMIPIFGGELLKVADPKAPNIPIVYLGHQQTFVLACGDKGLETKDSIRLEEAHMQPGGKVSCP